MAFDVKGAIEAGYSESEVADFLSSQNKFDAAGARSAGYSDAEIIGFVSSQTKADSKGLLSSIADKVGWNKGRDFKAPEGATDASFSAGMPASELSAPRNAVPKMTAGSVAQDIGAGVLQIVPTAVKGIADVGRIFTGDRVGTDLSKRMESDIKTIKKDYGSERSQVQQKNFDEDMANPDVSPGELLARNPSALADQILPTLGSMVLPVGAAGVAGKLATVGKAAQGMDKATVAARVASAQTAAGISATAAQNAADTFSTLLEKGASMEDAYLGAGITIPFTVIAGKLTGGGAEMALTRSLTGTGALKSGAAGVLKAGAKEGGQDKHQPRHQVRET